MPEDSKGTRYNIRHAKAGKDGKTRYFDIGTLWLSADAERGFVTLHHLAGEFPFFKMVPKDKDAKSTEQHDAEPGEDGPRPF